MHILITGGTGFIGPHQVEHALARGHRVTIFNRGRRSGLFGDRVEERLTGNGVGGTRGALASWTGNNIWGGPVTLTGHSSIHVQSGALAVNGVIGETGGAWNLAKTGNGTLTLNANGSFGYLPTPRQHRLGGYETWLGTNFVQQDASELIVDELLRLFRSMKSK